MQLPLLCSLLLTGVLIRIPSLALTSASSAATLVAVARTVLGVVVLCNFPLQIFPSRVSLLSLIDALSSESRGTPAGLPLRTPSMWVETTAAAEPTAYASPASESLASSDAGSSAGSASFGLFVGERRDVRVTILFLAFTGGVALIVSDLGVVVSVIGSTAATLISYVAPPAAHLLLVRRDERAAGGKDSSTALGALAALMLLLGVSILPSKLFCV